MDEIANYKPMNLGDVTSKGIPVGAMVGAGAGAIHGLMGKDEYDPQTGEKKSKIKKAIIESILGAGIGTVAVAASPVLTRGALDLGGRAGTSVGRAISDLGAKDIGKSVFGTGLKARIAATPIGTQLSLKQLGGTFK